MLYLIGLGLGDEKDITVKGLETVRSCEFIYLEAYTSILGVQKDRLEAFYQKEVIEADRDFVEQGIEEMLEKAKDHEVAFLVVGDVFGATTHSDLVLRAKQLGIGTKVIHNASIINASACCGLQLYRFGEIVSIPFFTESWRPDSFYDKIKRNREIGNHTLCLLDIKVKEQSMENLLRGKKIFEPPRYMTVNQCIEQLLEVEDTRKENVFSRDTICIGLARVGQETQQIVAGRMEDLLNVDFGGPLHSFVISGELHVMEKEYLDVYSVSGRISTPE